MAASSDAPSPVSVPSCQPPPLYRWKKTVHLPTIPSSKLRYCFSQAALQASTPTTAGIPPSSPLRQKKISNVGKENVSTSKLGLPRLSWTNVCWRTSSRRRGRRDGQSLSLKNKKKILGFCNSFFIFWRILDDVSTGLNGPAIRINFSEEDIKSDFLK